MRASSWPSLRADCEGWQRRGDVLSLGDKQLDYALVLCVEDLIVDELCLPPCARRIDDLDEWDGTLPIGPEGNAPSFVSACEVALAPGRTGEHASAFCQEPRGLGGTNDLGSTDALLGCEVERGRFAFCRGACDCAPVLIEEGERHADSRDQRSRSGGAFRADGESKLPYKVGAFGRHSRACGRDPLARGANVRPRPASQRHGGKRKWSIERHYGERPRLFTKEYAQLGSGSGEIGLLHGCVGLGAVAFELRANQVGFGCDTFLYATAVVRDYGIEPGSEIARRCSGNLRTRHSIKRARGIQFDPLPIRLCISLGSSDFGVCATHAGPALVQWLEREHGRQHYFAVHRRSCAPRQRLIIHLVHEDRIAQRAGGRARTASRTNSCARRFE